MINSIDSLTFSLYHSPGVFVPLAGSGVSRSATIPTGWEIVEDLVRRFAAQKGHQDIADPIEWYKDLAKRDPNYSDLLLDLAPGNAERQAILRSFFEPTEDERSRNLKVPTAAHHAIAELVARGYFRIIVSTNFDRLFEQALEERGIRPVVIAKPGDAAGAIPLAHSKCTLIKLHGDYLDTRLRNTERELSKYTPELRALLKRIVEEYGLIICGWSAQWDAALRQALASARNRRFLTFWTLKDGSLTPEANQLIAQRSALTIDISSADDFWRQVSDRLAGLEKYDKKHPVTVGSSLEQAKRYIADNRWRIELNDLVHSETESTYSSLFALDDLGVPPEPALYRSRLKTYEARLELLERIVATGTRWADPIHDDLWVRTIERIGNPPPSTGSGGRWYKEWAGLQYYPAVRLLYSAGIGTLIARRYDLLWRLLSIPRLHSPERETALILHANQLCLNGRLLREAEAATGQWPQNQYLSDSLPPSINELASAPHEHSRFFDTFQYFLSLVTVHLGNGSEYTPGRYAYTPEGSQVQSRLLDEFSRFKDRWRPLQQGFLEGRIDLFQAAIEKEAELRAQWAKY